MKRGLGVRMRDAWRGFAGKRTQRGMGPYKGAEISRLTADWVAQAVHPDQELLRDSRKLRARARDLARNASAIRYFRQLLASNVIGHSGMKIQGRAQAGDGTLDRTANQAVEDAWNAWAEEAVSIDGKLTLVAFEHLGLKTIATDGEVFIRFYRNFDNAHGLALQFIDPDQVDETFNRPPSAAGGEIRLGIEIDVYGRPVAYHVRDYPLLYGTTSYKRIRIPASEILHLYVLERANQTRGVTWLQTAMFKTQMKEGYEEAEVVAARTAAAKMGFFVSGEGVAGEMGEADASGAPPQMEANPATFEALPPGWKFEDWNPQHPSTAYPAFIKAIMRDIASGLGASYNVLANDLEGVNFSSMRSGLLTERDLWKLLQGWWIAKFRRPVYREWLNMALLKGALVLDGRRDARSYARVRWIPRGWVWVDPLKDVQASAEAILSGLASRQQILGEQGRDFEETVRQLAEEDALALELNVSIKPAIKAISNAPNPPADKGEAAGDGGDGEGAGGDGSGGSQ